MEPGIYYVDGSFEELNLDTSKNAVPEFKQLQQIIGGRLQAIFGILPTQFVVYADEEGLYKPYLVSNKTFPQIRGTVIVMVSDEEFEEE